MAIGNVLVSTAAHVAEASQPIGTAAGDLVALDGNGRLPAVDGSQLTNIGYLWTPDIDILNCGVRITNMSMVWKATVVNNVCTFEFFEEHFLVVGMNLYLQGCDVWDAALTVNGVSLPILSVPSPHQVVVALTHADVVLVETTQSASAGLQGGTVSSWTVDLDAGAGNVLCPAELSLMKTANVSTDSIYATVYTGIPGDQSFYGSPYVNVAGYRKISEALPSMSPPFLSNRKIRFTANWGGQTLTQGENGLYVNTSLSSTGNSNRIMNCLWVGTDVYLIVGNANNYNYYLYWIDTNDIHNATNLGQIAYYSGTTPLCGLINVAGTIITVFYEDGWGAYKFMTYTKSGGLNVFGSINSTKTGYDYVTGVCTDGVSKAWCSCLGVGIVEMDVGVGVSTVIADPGIGEATMCYGAGAIFMRNNAVGLGKYSPADMSLITSTSFSGAAAIDTDGTKLFVGSLSQATLVSFDMNLQPITNVYSFFIPSWFGQSGTYSNSYSVCVAGDYVWYIIQADNSGAKAAYQFDKNLNFIQVKKLLSVGQAPGIQSPYCSGQADGRIMIPSNIGCLSIVGQKETYDHYTMRFGARVAGILSSL